MTAQHSQNDDQNQLSIDDLGIRPTVIEQVPHLLPARKGTAASHAVRYKDFGALSFADIELFAKLPDHPLWSQVERFVDFSFADELCAHLYSSQGQRAYAPSLKLKIHLVQEMESLSDRETEVRLMFDMAIKRFLGVPFSFNGFDHSTIAFDRNRLGDELFHACFHYILAQTKQLGLWKGEKEIWLADSFHTHAISSSMSAYRLVFHGMLNLVNHLKRAHGQLHSAMVASLQMQNWFDPLGADSKPEERLAAFKLLVARAYALLSYLKQEQIEQWRTQETTKKQQTRFLELQTTLADILAQNTRPTNPTDPDSPRKLDTSEAEDYEKIPAKERPQNRIVNAHDPSVRNGRKTASQPFTGDKIQVVESCASGFILEIEPIPGNEADGERLASLIQSVVTHHRIVPEYLGADSMYGFGCYREQVDHLGLGIQVVAPVTKPKNPSGLLGSEHFIYDAQNKEVTCPAGNTTKKFYDRSRKDGVQYVFKRSVCGKCPMKEACTPSVKGRSIFISNYYEVYEEAQRFNESDEGQAILRARGQIEPTNNELANHHNMRYPKTRRRDKLRITAKMKGIAVNVKLIVRKLGKVAYKDPFVRHKPRAKAIAACA
ncbi:transposase [Paenibacillus sp. GCM10027628]|uniref:transposase n=1 Tax=Paenibacillus sp. GCM10027628 TaxID=3273413 RepID=UPI0036459CCA